MHGDFKPLIHPGTMSDDIDVERTRTRRQRLHERIRAHQLLEQFARQPLDLSAGVGPDEPPPLSTGSA